MEFPPNERERDRQKEAEEEDIIRIHDYDACIFTSFIFAYINESTNPSNYRLIKYIYFHVCCDFLCTKFAKNEREKEQKKIIAF